MAAKQGSKSYPRECWVNYYMLGSGEGTDDLL